MSRVLIGFGAHLNSNGNLRYMKLKFVDLNTGETKTHTQGDDSAGHLDAWYEVPDGNIITGLALKADSSPRRGNGHPVRP